MEEWRPIPDNPVYEVSNCARVRRAIAGRGSPAGRIMKQRQDKDGYWTTHLTHPVFVSRPFWVHRLVCLAFVGPQPSPEEFQVQHINGVRTDNRPENLKWGTSQDNSDDMRRHGTVCHRFGEEAPNRKLRTEQVMEIRRRRDAGEKLHTIAADFGVSFQLVSLIHKRKAWPHVGEKQAA